MARAENKMTHIQLLLTVVNICIDELLYHKSIVFKQEAEESNLLMLDPYVKATYNI